MLTEMMQICAGFGPVDLIAPNNGDWVLMENFNRCAIVFFKAAGTAGDDPTITVEQATTAAGSGNKALNFRRIDHKQGNRSQGEGESWQNREDAGLVLTRQFLGKNVGVMAMTLLKQSGEHPEISTRQFLTTRFCLVFWPFRPVNGYQARGRPCGGRAIHNRRTNRG